ncbi:MAG: hypothetical protein BAJALOKI2v1_240003 [Promethearchaeota archaeon]|nr:MAG: hypothetical protein BAJALOKI2v1_240003 [Candidatus Lokiarchaeota archaeon]
MSDLSQISETMLGPLWARATYSKEFPDLLKDEKAIEIIEKLDYDFSAMAEALGEWRAIGLMIRARKFDDAAKAYIEKYPSATIVNIGAGLDTTFSRIDNGTIQMYNLDVPEVIQYRKKLIPEMDRNHNLSESVFNYTWMDKIEFSKENGIFFIAGGFIYYFNEEKIAELMKTLATHFPGGEIIFDAVSNLAKKVVNKKAEKFDSELRFEFAINDPHEIIPKWSEKIDIKDNFVLGKRTSINKKWKLKTKIMNKFTQWIKTARVIHLKFKD